MAVNREQINHLAKLWQLWEQWRVKARIFIGLCEGSQYAIWSVNTHGGSYTMRVPLDDMIRILRAEALSIRADIIKGGGEPFAEADIEEELRMVSNLTPSTSRSRAS